MVARAPIIPHSGREAAHPTAVWAGYAQLPAPRELVLIDATGRAVDRIEARDPAEATGLAVGSVAASVGRQSWFGAD